MKKWKNIVIEKVLPEIRKNRINSYDIFTRFKQILCNKKLINNESFIGPHILKITDQLDLKFIALLYKKRVQERTNLENNAIYNCFKKTKFFIEMLKQTSSQIIKLAIKNAKIVKVPKKKLLFDIGDQINHYYVVLTGKIGILANSYKHYLDEKIHKQQIAQIINGLQSVPNKKLKSGKSKQTHPFLTNIQEEKIIYSSQLELEQMEFIQEILPQNSFGQDLQNDNNQTHRVAAVAIQDSYLLQMEFNSFFRAIKQHKQKKIKSEIEFFRKFKCFDLLEEQQLRMLISTSPIKQKAKNDFIFKAGDQSKQFYLLKQGEITLTKLAKLFRQNPNKLYMNRNQHQKNTLNILPYANFQNLYNYRPKQQNVELAILTKQTIFGEEQVILRSKRQTNAKVSSTYAKFYVININNLQNILNQKRYDFEDFQDFLFGTTTRKKILYRQIKFSQVLNFKNRTGLDYFYIDKNEIQSPKKFKLQKINNKIKKVNKTLDVNREPNQLPFYTTFNFTKLLNSESTICSPKKQTYSSEEKSMVTLTHGTNFIENQLSSEVQFHNTKYPQERQINLKNPLFEATYFRNLHRENKKLEQQYKNRKFSIRLRNRKKNEQQKF